MLLGRCHLLTTENVLYAMAFLLCRHLQPYELRRTCIVQPNDSLIGEPRLYYHMHCVANIMARFQTLVHGLGYPDWRLKIMGASHS